MSDADKQAEEVPLSGVSWIFQQALIASFLWEGSSFMGVVSVGHVWKYDAD